MTDYTALIDKMDSDGSSKLYLAADVNPDEEAGLRALASLSGVPAEALRSPDVRQEAVRQTSGNRYIDLLNKSPKTAEWLRTGNNALVSHDDTENLSLSEKALRVFGDHVLRPIGGEGAGRLAQGGYGLLAMAADAGEWALSPLAGTVLPGNPFTPLSKAMHDLSANGKLWAETYGISRGDYKGVVSQGIASGTASLWQSMLFMPMALEAQGVGVANSTINTLPTMRALLPMGGVTAGQSYQDAHEKGINGATAAAYALNQGGVEMATEALPLGKLLSDMKAGSAFLPMLGKQLVAENIGEQVATHWQDLNEWLVLHPEKTLQNYLDERPDAALQTAIATTFATGVQTSALHIVTRAGRKAEEANRAANAGAALQQVNELMQASKVLARDKETARDFLQSVMDEGNDAVYIDPKKLQESGFLQSASLLPEVREQLETAIATGHDVRIPIADLMTNLASPELGNNLLPHVSTEPGGYTMTTAKEFMEGSGMDDLKAEIEKTIMQAQDQEAFRASHDAVKQDVLDRLNELGRFRPDVNETYATLQAARVAVRAAQLGYTPEQFHQIYSPKWMAQDLAGGDRFNQSEGLAALSSRLAADGIQVEASERNGLVTLSKIIVPDGNRGVGKGTAAMQSIIDYADRTGQHIALTPSADFGGDRKRLTGFYKRFGFVENKGKNRAFSTKEGMYREAEGRVLYQGVDDGYSSADVDLLVTSGLITEEEAASLRTGANDYQVAGNGQEAGSAESGILSSFPKDIRYTSRSRLLRKIRKVSEAISNELGGSPETPRVGNLTLGPFSAYRAKAEVIEGDSIHPDGKMLVHVYGKEQVEAGLTDEPALTFTVAADGELIVNGPEPSSNTFAEFKSRGWADYARGKDGVIQEGWSVIRSPDAENGQIAVAQILPLLADVHARTRAWLGRDQVGLHWSRSTGATGGIDGGRKAVTFFQDEAAGPRGAYLPRENTIVLLRGANLSTALHELGHYFFEADVNLASELLARGRELTEGEKAILADVQALMNWHGIQGDIQSQMDQWHNMDFEEIRAYHEKTAESFERYLFTGKAPSIELQPYFNRFRDFLVSVYKSLKNFLAGHPDAGSLSPEVRQVFDRMLATQEQIQLAEQARSLVPIFETAEAAGMTQDQFSAYQALNKEAQGEAVSELASKAARDMQWSRNAHGRAINQLKKESNAIRKAVRMDIRREVLSEPVYRAWSFLTRKAQEGDALAVSEPRKSDPDIVDATQDSLFKAVAKFGGLNKDAVIGAWGIDTQDKPASGVFGKPVWRAGDKGETIEAMAERLAEAGYLSRDEHGKHDLAEFERRFSDELRGEPQYSLEYIPEDDQALPGADAAGVTSGKLDRDSVVGMYGRDSDTYRKLDRLGMLRNEGAIHPDIVSEIVQGFGSGDEMIQAIIMARSPNEEIEARTDSAMLAEHGELATPEAIAEAADRAVQNDVRARFVAAEANALAKAVGNRQILIPAVKQLAHEMVSRLKIRDIRPSVYSSAATRSAKAAIEASKKGDTNQAAIEKRNETIGLYAAREAMAAKDEVDSGLRYLKRFDGKIKGLDAGYIDQIDALLERFDLRKGQSLKAIDKRKGFAAWLEAQREAGVEPDVPEYLENDALRMSYKDLPLEEFRGLIDTIKQIEHIGRLKNRLLAAKDEREFSAIVAEAEGSIRENGGSERPVELEAPGGAMPWLEGFAAQHRKLASLARQMDGGVNNGPMWRALIRGMNDAGTKEASMVEAATVRLSEIFAPILAMKGGTDGDKRYIKAIDASLTRGGRLAIALNWGNETNRKRIMDGDKWSQYQVNEILRTLTREEWAFVQETWDFIDGYWQEIADKERRLTGRAPEKVEASPFQIALDDGDIIDLRGGYYPIKYDAGRDDRAEQHEAMAVAEEMMRGAVTRSTTRRNHTKGRVEDVNRPVKKDLGVITQHVSEVVHDLSWHEWLIDANRLINNRSVNQAIRDHYGPAVIRTMKDTLSGIAAGDLVPQTKMDQALLYLRANVSRSTMGYSLTTAILQPFGLLQSTVRIGWKYMLRGMKRWGGDIGRFQSSAKWINEKSEFMRLRSKTFNRELHEIKGRVINGHSKARQIYDASLFMLMQKMQMVADVPTWIGAYEKALDENHDEATAIALADQAVLDSQGGGQTKDLSELQRKHPMLTMFYSYFNVTMNMVAESTAKTDFRSPMAIAGWMSDMALLLVIPALAPAMLLYFMKGGGDDDDDAETWAKRLAEWQAGYLLGMVIGLRELSGAVSGFDYAGPPAGRVVADLGKLKKQAEQGDLDEGLATSSIQVLGAMFGIPTVQMLRSWRGWNAWMDDEAPVTGVLLGPPPKD